ncbi:inorganic diphosphatase [Candidatus Woesearchaeota archaeon]|nr:inorganic diphosphatase [Candidatus Woesearchaeota archaeon]
MTAHPWHDLPFGEHAPDEVQAFIEVPKGSRLKYELDKDSGFIKLDRVLYSAVHYPGDYGFIPQTLSEDGDPTDIVIIANFPVHPSTIVRARPIGILEMVDADERDEKIIAVHASDPRFDRYQDLEDMGEHQVLEIKHFFETYKQLQGKDVEIKGIHGKEAAHEAIRKAIESYQEGFIE